MDDYYSIADGDLNGLEQFLLDSRYSENYREQLAVSNQALLGRIENAVAAGSCKELLHIKSIALGEPALLLEIIFSRADILNSRLILRALATKTISGPPPRWHSYGALGSTFYDDLWRKSPSIMDITERCYSDGHPFAIALADSLLDFNRGIDIQVAERVLLLGVIKRLFASLENISSSNARIVRKFLGLTVDMWNIGIWIRRRAGYVSTDPTDDVYIVGGAWLDSKKLTESKAMADLVHATPWRKVVRGIDEKAPRDFQRALSIDMWNWQMNLFREDPLGIQVAIGYVAKQLVEWENLNLLSVGMAMGLSSQNLLNRLIHV